MRSKKHIVQRRKRALVRNVNYFSRKYLNILFLFLKIFVVFLLLFSLLRLILISGYFNVKKISINGAERFVNKADVDLLVRSNLYDKNLLYLNLDDIKDKLKTRFLGAKEINVKKSFPSTIQVSVVERVPIAMVTNTSSTDYFLIDSEGYILGIVDPNETDLPEINYEQDLRVGTFIAKNLVPLYSEITELLEKEEIKVSSISFNLKNFEFYVDNGPKVYVGNDKNLPESINAIKLLLKQVAVEDKDLERIDLRYDKVVVSFK